ncbi:hypothetical protein [Methanolobus chelungpuianus]|uniref:Uncharacterized protein n=1 Tax=Methanolobus chelungpuianus TaxID=502115 RepID=A0AAE3HB77_9EURY|nr:hypothetical protein [Methanolobus chelungpuianus]MCQ6962982.1 hypothetical protein [Methanolobus chelungpuianus]
MNYSQTDVSKTPEMLSKDCQKITSVEENSDASISHKTNTFPKVDDLQYLRSHPIIREYASMDDRIYDLIKATNPTLLIFVDLAKRIVAGE